MLRGIDRQFSQLCRVVFVSFVFTPVSGDPADSLERALTQQGFMMLRVAHTVAGGYSVAIS